MATKKFNPSGEVKFDSEHKCLLYWHRTNMHRIPLGKGDYMILYPGYNTFSSNHIPTIYNECEDLLEMGYIELKGITRRVKESGEVTYSESLDLRKITIQELNEILESTYNPDTLNDLSDSTIVNAMFIHQAAHRKNEISQYVGTEADNIEVVK